MGFSLVVDWKFVAALGGSVVLAILAVRVSLDAAERVLDRLSSAALGLLPASDRGR